MSASITSAMGCHGNGCVSVRIEITLETNAADSAAHPGQRKEHSVAARKNHGQNARRVRRPMPANTDSPVAIVHLSISEITMNCVSTPTVNSHRML